jgi:hypothetical protein
MGELDEHRVDFSLRDNTGVQVSSIAWELTRRGFECLVLGSVVAGVAHAPCPVLSYQECEAEIPP